MYTSIRSHSPSLWYFVLAWVLVKKTKKYGNPGVQYSTWYEYYATTVLYATTRSTRKYLRTRGPGGLHVFMSLMSSYKVCLVPGTLWSHLVFLANPVAEARAAGQAAGRREAAEPSRGVVESASAPVGRGGGRGSSRFSANPGTTRS